MRIVLQTMGHGAQYFWAQQQFLRLAEDRADACMLVLSGSPQDQGSGLGVIRKYARRGKLAALVKNAAMRPFFKSTAAAFERKSGLIDAAISARLEGDPPPFRVCANQAEARRVISDFGADRVVVIGSPVLAHDYFLEGVRYFNLHLGRIPDYRGLKCIEWAILNDDPEAIGYTVHEMTPLLDLGQIFHFETIPSEGKTLSQIYTDCYFAGIMRCLEIAFDGPLEGVDPMTRGRLYQSIDFTNLEKYRLLQKVQL